MSATSEQGGSTLSINYVDKFIPDRQPRPSAANMNENRHQIHQLLLQAGDDTTRTTQRQVRLPSGADTTRTTKPNAVFTGKSAARGYDAMSRNAPSVNTPRDNLETGGKDVLRTANKEGLSSNELLFRRIVNMFNKSYIWTTLKYGRSGGSRKRGRLFRKKYKGGGCSDSLLVGSDSNEVYRSDSFKFERFPKGGPNDGVVRIMEDEHGRNTRNCVWRAERGLTTAFHKISLSEDYSIPVDFVNKNLETKSLASPTGETVDLLEGYCDPRDSKAYSNPGDTPDVKIYTSPDGDYSHPYLINAFLLAKTPGGLVRNSSDVEDIYEDIHIQDFTSPRIITSPISLPTSPTSPLIEFRTSPYYYSELISKNPTYNINNIKTSTLTPYKKTSHYRTKPSSQTLKNVNLRSYVPKVASEQLNELHKRFAASDNGNKDTTVRKIEEQYSVVNKRNKENVQHCADANGNIQSDITANINKLFVDGRINSLESPVLTDNSHDSDDIPPEKPPLVRNGHLININNKTSFCKNFTYQETSDEENNTRDKQVTSPISPCDNIKLFEKPSFQNFGPPKLNRPNSLSFKSNNEFETFHGNKLNKINVCNNKPPLQPKKSQLNRSTFGKARPRSLECERVTIAVKSNFTKNRPKSLETPKFEIDDEFFQTQLEQSRNNLNLNQIYFLPSPYTENDFSERIEQIKEEEEEDMSRGRHIYETAFDSKVSKSDDDLDIDEVTHRSLLNLKRPNSACGFVSSKLSFRTKLVKSKSANLQKFTSLKPKYLASVESLTESLNEVSIKHSPSPDKTFTNITNLPNLSCSKNLTPPSTEPLPPKFSNMNIAMTPKSLKYKLDKPKKPKNSFLHATISKIRAKYSSSDSMTSSSNSLESINSSSSNNSRSNSISSHSSDGASTFNIPIHPVRHTKLNILSPISDKSFMEQSSEHDGHKTTTAVIIEDKKPSPDTSNNKCKKRVLQNKNLPNQIENHQGSDSGISVESKNDLFKDFNHPFDQTKIGKKRESDTNNSQRRDSINSIDIQDLPFDMPKLRKKRQAPQLAFTLQANLPPSNVNIHVEDTTTHATNTQTHHSSHNQAIVQESTSCNTSNTIKEPDIQPTSNSQTNPKDTTSLSSLELSILPFDMPKLRRKLQQESCLKMNLPPPVESAVKCASSDVPCNDRIGCPEDVAEDKAGSCYLEESSCVDKIEEKLPFDMPKLRRRMQQLSSQDGECPSTSQSSGPTRPLSLNMNAIGTVSSLRKQANCLSLNLVPAYVSGEPVDVDLPLERQGWYHGSVTRHEAENILRNSNEGSYLVRNSESNRPDYSLSLKSARGFMHMKIQRDPDTGKFILGQFSAPFDSVPEMIQHFAENRLPILGAEHMCLLHPMIEQLL